MQLFEPVLVGDARHAAMKALAELIQPRFSGEEHQRADIEVMRMARQDASLLVEPLNSDFGVQVYRYQRGGRHEATGTAGTWLMHAADKGMHRTIRYMLERGIHPDEPRVFMKGGLLSTRGWAHNDDLLALALEFGANPDVQTQPTLEGNWAGTPGQIQVGLLCNTGTSATGPLRRLAQLLRAGARTTTVVDDGRRTAVAPVSAACAITPRSYRDDEELTLATDVLRLLCEVGADIDTPAPNGLPPVVSAIRRQRLELAKVLIEGGCRVDDEHIVKEGVKPLLVEAAGWKGNFATQIEALLVARRMREQLAASPVEVTPAPQMTRRSARASI